MSSPPNGRDVEMTTQPVEIRLGAYSVIMPVLVCIRQTGLDNTIGNRSYEDRV